METAFSRPGGSSRSGGGEDAGALSLHQRIARGGGDDQRIAMFERLQNQNKVSAIWRWLQVVDRSICLRRLGREKATVAPGPSFGIADIRPP